MSFVLVNATNNGARDVLLRWFGKPGNFSRRTYLRKHFLRKMGPATYLLHANGKILALLYDLKQKYPNDIYIFAAEPLEDLYIPDEIKDVVDRCREKKRPPSKEELDLLERIRIDCSVNSRTGSSP